MGEDEVVGGGVPDELEGGGGGGGGGGATIWGAPFLKGGVFVCGLGWVF